LKWSRTIPFSADHSLIRTENWHCHRDDGSIQSFDVAVRIGKQLDVLSLKGLDLALVREYAAFLSNAASQLYGKLDLCHHVDHCVCCGEVLSGKETEVLRIFQVPYVRCKNCGHVFVPLQPKSETLQAVFEQSENHSSAYVDHSAAEIRLRQIIAPKLQWCLEQFALASRGKRPRSVIDVGAGGGHFLAGAIRAGLSVEGFELSKVSRAFACEAFGIDLRGDDFLSAECVETDLITFWGLLEYVPEPARFIEAAKGALGSKGMLVVEVPRVDSLSTVAQMMPGAVVARHMDPTSHINGFSDESLMTMLIQGGFKPVAAWYFGMDIYELIVQMALRNDDDTILESMADFIPRLQQAVDLGRQCDDIIIAAVPLS
jgi:2-polyprenyl-3-methyl-5-hydroxy-6-metoxy-1,4-benzoquinol methylase